MMSSAQWVVALTMGGAGRAALGCNMRAAYKILNEISKYLIAILETTVAYRLASYPGPTHFLITCSIRRGRAWENSSR